MADPIFEALRELLEALHEQFPCADNSKLSPRVIKAANEAGLFLLVQPPDDERAEPPAPDEVREAFAELERRQENLHRFRDLRTALAAEPPAPDPHEALAARPLLEAVARMADRIGQHTVGEITAISDRAAAWLAENPQGQPVAIEPRGCPAPGACSCVDLPAPAPDPSDFQTFQGIALDMVESLRPIVIPEILDVLRKAIKSTGQPAPSPAPTAEGPAVPQEGREPAAVAQQGSAAPAADGERSGRGGAMRRAACGYGMAIGDGCVRPETLAPATHGQARSPSPPWAIPQPPQGGEVAE